jgi:hypothetical protein
MLPQDQGRGNQAPFNLTSNLKTAMDEDFDPKHFVKKIETELVFDSDGEPEMVPKEGNREISSVDGKQIDSSNGNADPSNEGQKLLDGSLLPEEVVFHKEKKENFQYQDTSIKGNTTANLEGRKFSGIYEDDYFMFVEDYDNFIGEFVSDEKVKIVRGFLNHNEYNRIYYTRMVPTEKVCANLLFVHGFGHTVKYLDVAICLPSSLFSSQSRESLHTYLTSEVLGSPEDKGITQPSARSMRISP